MVASYIPDRGDVIWLHFSPQAGHEEAGHRTAVVLSPRLFNDRTGFAIVCPTTNTVRGHPLEVALPPAADATGVILVHHVKSLDWIARKAELKGRVQEATLRDVLSKLATILDLD